MKHGSYLLFFLLFALGTARGQTITWTAATNPHVVSGTYTVPAGQTLVMEAGVIVNINSNSTLQVNGQLIGNGTAASRITINGAVNFSSLVNVSGTSNLAFTNVRAQVRPYQNGVLLFSDCNFSNNGTIFNNAVQSAGRAPYLQFDRCAFQGNGTNQSSSLYLAYATVVLRNTSFTNGAYCSVYPGYLYLDQVSSDRSSNFGLALGSDGDLYLNNITVTNAAHPGLQLAGDTRNGTNVLIGPNVTLTGNEFPVHLTIAGLYPGSVVPATGNLFNFIHVSDYAGDGGLWPKLAIPYYSDDAPLSVDNGLRIFPGVTVKMAAGSYFSDSGFGNGVRAFGTKDQPILFERADPAQAWSQLHADRTEGGRLRHTIVRGNSGGVNGGQWRLENCVLQSNALGTTGTALVSGTQYLANTIGHDTGANGSLNGGANPNTFDGNGTGVNYSPDARNSWWGSPTGPRIPSNPSGTGDSIANSATPYQPFLTARPDYSDAPPEVVLLRPSFQLDQGSKVMLRWNASDDGAIASQRILFSPVGNVPSAFQTVATLPGDQRSYEWTVPNIGFTVNGNNAFIKVIAVDNTGKESFDEAEIILPTNDIVGTVTFGFAAGQTFTPGEFLQNVYTVANLDPNAIRVEYYLEDVRGESRKLFGRGINNEGLPFYSTDTARFVVAYGGTTNRRKYFYSPFFKIRPDARVNDAPPSVTLTSPQPGQPIPANTVIPIAWNASDDEGLRSFDLIASYDAGRTWQPIVKDLPGTARNYDWLTAPGTGFATGVRVKVIAKDWRFQSSSDGTDRITAVSRKTHGGSGVFDLDLPLSGSTGVECRSGGASENYQVVVTFPSAVTANNARVLSGNGTVASFSTAGAQVTVDLSNVVNGQRMMLAINAAETGASAADVVVPMAFLVADVNGNGSVNASDISQTKSFSGQMLDATNFRADVNVSGSINASDIGQVKAMAGTALP